MFLTKKQKLKISVPNYSSLYLQNKSVKGHFVSKDQLLVLVS